ncbi:MAG: phosphotransferase, partial [bacterium]|nr:phosphotransferase [bacterium]
MVTEPNIKQAELLDLLNKEYPLQVKSLTFLPKGEVSWVYILKCTDGAKYLLKIHKAKVLPAERFGLLSDLHEKAGINGLTYPQPTKDGQLQVEILGYPAVLFNYIEGKTALEAKPTDEEYEKFGALLAKIHQAG